jgi:hypothetical protein
MTITTELLWDKRDQFLRHLGAEKLWDKRVFIEVDIIAWISQHRLS